MTLWLSITLKLSNTLEPTIIIFLLLTLEKDMVLREQQGFELHEDANRYHWVDIEVLRMTSILIEARTL